MARRDDNIFFTIKEIAELLGVSLSTFKRILNRGEIRISKIGGRRRIHQEDFAAFVSRVRNVKRGEQI